MSNRERGWLVKLIDDFAAADSPLQPVVFTQLSRNYCFASAGQPLPSAGVNVDLWIGEIGPLAATVDNTTHRSIKMKFHTPLLPEVLSHFTGRDAADLTCDF